MRIKRPTVNGREVAAPEVLLDSGGPEDWMPICEFASRSDYGSNWNDNAAAAACRDNGDVTGFAAREYLIPTSLLGTTNVLLGIACPVNATSLKECTPGPVGSWCYEPGRGLPESVAGMHCSSDGKRPAPPPSPPPQPPMPRQAQLKLRLVQPGLYDSQHADLPHGYVQVKMYGKWGYVCSAANANDRNVGNTLCKQLGYRRGLHTFPLENVLAYLGRGWVPSPDDAQLAVVGLKCGPGVVKMNKCSYKAAPYVDPYSVEVYNAKLMGFMRTIASCPDYREPKGSIGGSGGSGRRRLLFTPKYARPPLYIVCKK